MPTETVELAVPAPAVSEHTGYLEVPVPVSVLFDADDVCRALGNNDELIVLFIRQLLEEAGSSELRERLAAELATWDADRADP